MNFTSFIKLQGSIQRAELQQNHPKYEHDCSFSSLQSLVSVPEGILRVMVAPFPLSALKIKPKIVREKVIGHVLSWLTKNVDRSDLKEFPSIFGRKLDEFSHLPEESHYL